MPEGDDKWLFFKNYHQQLPIPFVIYADLESLLVKVDSCSADPTTSNSEIVDHHLPCGYSYVVVGPDGKLVKPAVLYRGVDTINHFWASILEEEQAIKDMLADVKPLHLTPEDWKDFRKATTCHICDQLLDDKRVRDHCHVTGVFRGAAHPHCNLKYKISWKIPVIFHNGRNYDSHLLFQGLGLVKNKKIGCIATTMEKYVTFSVGKLQFLDSCQFLPTSLASLVSNLSDHLFHVTRQEMGGDKLHLLVKKGIYPYQYMDKWSRFEEPCLPPKEEFFSSLTKEEITDADYRHAQQVWEEFHMKDMGEYHDLYLKTDVLLLADVFENFRHICLLDYKLDPCHFYTAPGLSWAACLKMTDAHLELFTDPNMHLFIEKSIRGGISMISQRLSVANNPCLPDYDPAQENKYIMYLDANNLYGWAMSQHLPTRNFSWDTQVDKYTAETILALGDEDPEGYFLEVDLVYPHTLHDAHNDYPLAAETLQITTEMMSPYLAERGVKTLDTTKLCPNLRDKEHYVLHYRNLKLYLQLGLQLKKVHRVLKFDQTPWMKSYINFNTERRKESQSAFEKDFYKLMNNSVFGKTMENIRNHKTVDITTSSKQAQRLVNCPSFHAYEIYHNDLVVVQRLRTSLTLNKPIYSGATILDVSKTLMYSFHYQHIKAKYGARAQLCFTDTDSLCYEIKTPDIYQDMSVDQHLYDTSDYPKEHPLHNQTNKKALGKMKDEMSGTVIREFVGLRPKMYSILTDLGEKKTAKGVAKSVVKHYIKHQDYKRCLLEGRSQMHLMNRIASKKHDLFTVKQNKRTLSPLDDKRFMLPDGISSYAYGHYKIRTTTSTEEEQGAEYLTYEDLPTNIFTLEEEEPEVDLSTYEDFPSDFFTLEEF